MPAPLLGGAGGGLVHGKSVVVMRCAVKLSALVRGSDFAPRTPWRIFQFRGFSLMFLNQHGLPWSCRPM